MSFEKQMTDLTRRYWSEVKGVDVTADEVQKWPRWQQVWDWWKAMEHYDGKKLPMSLEDCKSCYGD